MYQTAGVDDDTQNELGDDRLKSVRTECGVKDEIDEHIEKEKEEEEEIDPKANLGRFEAGEAQEVSVHNTWMERIAFGSKTLPEVLCMIGDAQPELVKVFLFLLQSGANLNFI